VQAWLGPWSAMGVRSRIIHLAWLIPAGAAVYGAALAASGLRPRHVREHP